MNLKTARVATMQGSLRIPPDKSLTHRALMLAAIADGDSMVRRPLRSEDCEATLRCLGQMGLQAVWISDDEVALRPASEWLQPNEDLDCGNSGTTMRLLSGLVASRELVVRMVGDASLSRRPMARIADPLRRMGAAVEGETPPLRIRGSNQLRGLRYQSPIASAQVKSCVLLAGLRAEGETHVVEPEVSRDHTERMLTACGVEVLRESPGSVGVAGGSRLRPFEMTVPGDISSAAFFLVAAALIPEAELTLEGVGVNPTRTGILDVFRQAEIPVLLDGESDELGEPVADLVVRSVLHPLPFRIEGGLVPRLIDEIPVLAVMATQCDGVSEIRNARELRVKESDRIEVMAKGLRAMGAMIETHEDGMTITGPTRLHAVEVDAGGDHRIAMSFAIAGLIADGTTTIRGAEAIATSFPSFETDLWRLCVV
jgi:3-phosphoshikimate 1-carboxyvinyltransferase